MISDLEGLYKKLKAYLALTNSYSEEPILSEILMMCRMKPYNFMFFKRDSNLKLFKHWYDEFNCSIYLDKKNIDIKLNDLSINIDRNISTDLYGDLSIYKIFKISKLLFVSFGQDDVLESNYAVISILGIDNYLRSFMFLDNQWVKVSSLIIGLDNLKSICLNKQILFSKKLNNNKYIMSESPNEWICGLPLDKDLLNILAIHCKPLLDTLNKKENK